MCFLNDAASTQIYTLSLHDALPISLSGAGSMSIRDISWIDLNFRLADRPQFPSACSPTAEKNVSRVTSTLTGSPAGGGTWADRKSTRLNSSHANISYAVFCLQQQVP